MKHVLIVSLRRSGGKLMRMLLDGHSQVNAFPFEHWNRASKLTFPARRITVFDRLSVEDKLRTAGDRVVEKKLRRRHSAALAATVIDGWRRDAAGAATLPEHYESLARRYFSALHLDAGRLVVNHCGSACVLTRAQLDAVFGPGVHLLPVRDPRAVFASMEALRTKAYTIKRLRRQRVAPHVIARHVEKMEVVHGASGYLREFCEQYRHMVAEYVRNPEVVWVRFEDLVTAPEATLRRVGERLSLPWEPVLTRPTEFGEQRGPNSSFERKGDVVHARAADDWVERIDPAARAFIERELAGEMAALGYTRAAVPAAAGVP